MHNVGVLLKRWLCVQTVYVLGSLMCVCGGVWGWGVCGGRCWMVRGPIQDAYMIHWYECSGVHDKKLSTST